MAFYRRRPRLEAEICFSLHFSDTRLHKLQKIHVPRQAGASHLSVQNIPGCRKINELLQQADIPFGHPAYSRKVHRYPSTLAVLRFLSLLLLLRFPPSFSSAADGYFQIRPTGKNEGQTEASLHLFHSGQISLYYFHPQAIPAKSAARLHNKQRVSAAPDIRFHTD